MRETTSCCLFCFLTLENPLHVDEVKIFADREAKKTDHSLRHLANQHNLCRENVTVYEGDQEERVVRYYFNHSPVLNPSNS